MSARVRIDPELEELLLDVAADRDALLLRIPSAQAFRAAFEERVDVSEGATGLTAAERQLVRVHRAELAYLLRVAAVDRLHRTEQAAERMIRSIRPNERIPDDIGNRSKSMARKMLSRGCMRSAGLGEDIEGLSELLAAIQDDQEIDVTRIAALSMRLAPTRQARCYQGLDFSFKGRLVDALRVFGELATLDGNREQQSVAWTNVAMVLGELERHDEEFEAAQRATAYDDRLLMAHADVLITGLQLGRFDEAFDSAAAIDGLVDVDHPGARDLLHHANRIRARMPEPASRIYASSARLNLPPQSVAFKILHELK